MNWFIYLVMFLFTVGSIATISNIDEPRAPITHNQAVVIVICNSLLTIGLYALLLR